ncbi:hypothetical protein ACFV3R_15805 [Streptomyces sp. NPDC059740]|uniref:hypothetical protein n=1 Tax=Streptomyces sp. NPDC059740 TaxID=3346926 RepID=UPI003664E7F1
MVRNLLGSLIALAGAVAALWSPFRPWYNGRLGSSVRIEDVVNGITRTEAGLFGSLLLPMLFAALVTLLGLFLRSRALVTLAGLVVLAVTVLWMVRQGQAAGGLSVGSGGRGLGVGVGTAAVAGFLLLLAAAVMRGRTRYRRRGAGRRREAAEPYPEVTSYGGYRDYDDQGYPVGPPARQDWGHQGEGGPAPAAGGWAEGGQGHPGPGPGTAGPQAPYGQPYEPYSPQAPYGRHPADEGAGRPPASDAPTPPAPWSPVAPPDQGPPAVQEPRPGPAESGRAPAADGAGPPAAAGDAESTQQLPRVPPAGAGPQHGGDRPAPPGSTGATARPATGSRGRHAPRLWWGSDQDHSRDEEEDGPP